MFFDKKAAVSSSAQPAGQHNDEPRLETLLHALRSELDDIHSSDAELHQLWLETQWLQSNLKSDVLCLPRNWELIIFRMVKGKTALTRHARAYEVAFELASELRAAVPHCE